jgi:hypothetical protein
MRKRLAKKISLCCLVCLLMVVAGCTINIGGCCGNAKYERSEQLNASMSQITTLDVATNVGSITITGTEDTKDCNVTANITAKADTKEEAKKLVEQIKIRLEPNGDKLRVTTEGSMKCISLNFNIKVPKRINIDCRTDVGSINVSNITGNINATTNVGSINAEAATGKLNFKNDVGDISVKYAADAPAACQADMKTDVGKIEFTGPNNMSAQLEAKTDVGSIDTALPVTVTGKVGKNLNGKIGNGEGKVYLSTKVGAITIK